MHEESKRIQVGAVNESLWLIEPNFTMLLSFHYDFFESLGIFLSMSFAERYLCFGDRAAVVKGNEIGKSG